MQTLERTDLRVLLLCCTAVDAAQRVRYTQRQMARTLGIHPPAVSRAVRLLVAHGLLVKERWALYVNARLVGTSGMALPR